jgi:hypothetical protein
VEAQLLAVWIMERILVCLAVGEGADSDRIRRALEQSGRWELRDVKASECYEDFAPCCPEVVVMDDEAFDRMPLPLDHPERVVLLAHRGRSQLQRAWEAGIISVVWETDPTETIFLAIQAAALRCRPSRVRDISPKTNRPN